MQQIEKLCERYCQLDSMKLSEKKEKKDDAAMKKLKADIVFHLRSSHELAGNVIYSQGKCIELIEKRKYPSLSERQLQVSNYINFNQKYFGYTPPPLESEYFFKTISHHVKDSKTQGEKVKWDVPSLYETCYIQFITENHMRIMNTDSFTRLPGVAKLYYLELIELRNKSPSILYDLKITAIH
jgi:hypothetical protein